MRKKRQKDNEPADEDAAISVTNHELVPRPPKYDKPRILTMDLPSECASAIRDLGYRCDEGAFGTPYKVQPSESAVPVIVRPRLPDYTEQEIIIVDLTPPDTADEPEGEPPVSINEKNWLCKCARGEIDPRARVMFSVKDDFDRILEYGGVFIIFAQPRLDLDFYFTTQWQADFSDRTRIPCDNWSFLSVLHNLKIDRNHGREISLANEDAALLAGLKKYAASGTYTATVSPEYLGRDEWTELFKDKYDRAIGGVLVRKAKHGNGAVWILPQFSDKAGIITLFFQELLPAVSPHLFPEFEGGRWVEREEYQLPSIRHHLSSIDEVNANAKRKIEAIEAKIIEERSRFGFLTNMLTAQGPELVKCVEDCLKFFGFSSVVNVDEMLDSVKENSHKQEDLQILDDSPLLLVEVKGIAGKPREADVIQVLKYVTRRTTEWNRPDVRGVCIDNHQKNLPALEREDTNAFQAPQPEDAEASRITLITTWDLFLLAKGKLRWGWPSEVIQGLFSVLGRMPRIPLHYKPVGTVDKFWPRPEVVSIRLDEMGLSKGQRIAFVTAVDYLEQDALSLQVGGKDIEVAEAGEIVAVEVEYDKSQIPKRTGVYVVQPR